MQLFAPLVAGTISVHAISEHWFELLRLAMSIKTGTVTASLILRKLTARINFGRSALGHMTSSQPLSVL